MNPEQTPLNTNSVNESLPPSTISNQWLVLGLLVTLPFVGGFVGYNLASEKIVYVDKPVIESQTEVPGSTEDSAFTLAENDRALNITNLMDLNVGDTFYGLTVVSKEPFGGYDCEDEICTEKIPMPISEDNIVIYLKGELVMRGSLWAPTGNPLDGGVGPAYGMSNLTLTPLNLESSFFTRFGIDNEDIFNQSNVKNRDLVEVVVTDYKMIKAAAGVWDTATISSVRKIE